jgi:hypothetical protein
LPSYKFDPKSNNYDTSSKLRVPSYTDRVLFFSNPDQLRLLNYTVIPQVDFSDHRPVIGMFEVQTKVEQVVRQNQTQLMGEYFDGQRHASTRVKTAK